MGMDVVARLAAAVSGAASVTMRSTLRRTSSAASAGSRSNLPSAYRYSMARVWALDVAELAQPLAERLIPGDVRRGTAGGENPDAGNFLRRLRVGGEPRCEDPERKRDDEPDRGLHPITSSAPRSTDGGIVRPRAFDVFRLTTKLNSMRLR